MQRDIFIGPRQFVVEATALNDQDDAIKIWDVTRDEYPVLTYSWYLRTSTPRWKQITELLFLGGIRIPQATLTKICLERLNTTKESK